MTGPKAPVPTVDEARALLRRIAGALGPAERAIVAAQVESIVSVSGTAEYLDLHLEGDPPRLDWPEAPLHARGDAADAEGEPLGGFLVWMKTGLLDSIEFHVYTADSYTWPPLDAVEPRLRD
ncbi:hypothetical protein [Frondihabitans australicus]|uniref:hypothetical protein n=1 Tax=Frondihabitans australicus TaxID=386892 RepID=UPI000EB39138|nr:hypothetical protein [Frondihabitans australicus]